MDWFTDLTGLTWDDPATVRAGVQCDGEWLLAKATGRRMRAGRLVTPSLAELRHQTKNLDRGRRTSVQEIVADAGALHQDPAHAGAVFQVASQFNLLEMIGPHVTPDQGIARYANDHTQGPVCAMACGAGTLYRNYFVPLAGQVGQSAGQQLDMAADLHTLLRAGAEPLWQMKNGYLLPRAGGLARAAAALAAGRGAARGSVRIGVQENTEVTLPGAEHLVHQVYASAAPLAYAPAPSDIWEPLATVILEAAYEATLAAALDLVDRGASGLVFLTALGGGAFGNPAPWIAAALERALGRYAQAGLDVRLVSYGQPNPLWAHLLDERRVGADPHSTS